jgi:hypothetical protein
MSVELTKSGKTRYTQKIRINGRVITKHLGLDDAGRIAHEAIASKRTNFELLRNIDRNLEIKYDRIEKIANLVTEQHFANKGLIKRQCIWKIIERLNEPLTIAEQTYINGMKTGFAPCNYALLNPTGSSTYQESKRLQNEIFNCFSTTKNPMKDQHLISQSEPQVTSNRPGHILADPALVEEYIELSRELQSHALKELLPKSPIKDTVKENLNYLRDNLQKDGESSLEQLVIDQILTNYLYSGFTGVRLDGLDIEKAFCLEPNHHSRLYEKANQRLFKSMHNLQKVRDVILTIKLHERKKQARKAKRTAAQAQSQHVA